MHLPPIRSFKYRSQRVKIPFSILYRSKAHRRLFLNPSPVKGQSFSPGPAYGGIGWKTVGDPRMMSQRLPIRMSAGLATLNSFSAAGASSIPSPGRLPRSSMLMPCWPWPGRNSRPYWPKRSPDCSFRCRIIRPGGGSVIHGDGGPGNGTINPCSGSIAIET